MEGIFKILTLGKVKRKIIQWEIYLERHPEDRKSQGILKTLKWVEKELNHSLKSEIGVATPCLDCQTKGKQGDEDCACCNGTGYVTLRTASAHKEEEDE